TSSSFACSKSFRQNKLYVISVFYSLFSIFDRQQAHLVLSGGLGNSPYVQRRLQERYSSGSAPFSNARSLQVRVAPEPQLVVCKGIVADRVQKLKSGRSVLGWRCC